MTIAQVIALALWGLTAACQLISARAVVRERDYHPAYKILKTVLGGVAILAVAARLTGLNAGRDAGVYFATFAALILGASLLEWRLIRRRNRDPHYLTVRTRKGIVDVLSRADAELVVSEAAGIIRHQILEGREYVDERALVELRDALGLPANGAWEARLREEMRQRRERLGRDRIMAAEIQQWRREIAGERGEGGAP